MSWDRSADLCAPSGALDAGLLAQLCPRGAGWVLGAAAVIAVCAGCVDPEASYQDWRTRYEETLPASGGSGGSGGDDAGPCALPEPEELDGTYLLAVSTPIGRDKPVVYLATAAAALRGGSLFVTLQAQALDAKDRKTLVGEALPAAEVEVTAGGIVLDLGVTEVDGRANPILYGTAIEADTTLTAQLCSVRSADEPAAKLDFFCGDVTGELIKPLPASLETGTFTATRVEGVGSYPEPPLINCGGTEASPLEAK